MEARYHHHPHEEEQILPHSHGGGHPHVHTNTKAVVNRMNRAIGHLQSVRQMVEDDRDCSEVLIQLAAVTAAINGVARVIMKDHIDHCIVDAVERGDRQAIEDLERAIDQFIK